MTVFDCPPILKYKKPKFKSVKKKNLLDRKYFAEEILLIPNAFPPSIYCV
jgi:hypothetical protein